MITEEESPAIRDWLTWRDIFHFVDILCCCAILFPIVWSIKQVGGVPLSNTQRAGTQAPRQTNIQAGISTRQAAGRQHPSGPGPKAGA